MTKYGGIVHVCMSVSKRNMICAEKMVNMEVNGVGGDISINNKEMLVMVNAC